LVSRYTHACLSNPTTRQAVRWLERKYFENNQDLERSLTEGLTRCLRHPICTLSVVLAIETLSRDKTVYHGPASDGRIPSVFEWPHGPPLRVPIRVFRGLVPPDLDADRPTRPSADSRIVPPDPPTLSLVEHLMKTYRFDEKSLARGLRYAVFADHVELAKFMIERGASIHSDDLYELEVAARRRNLDMLRALLETTFTSQTVETPHLPLLQQSDLDKIAKWASREMLQYFEETWNMRPSLKSILSL